MGFCFHYPFSCIITVWPSRTPGCSPETPRDSSYRRSDSTPRCRPFWQCNPRGGWKRRCQEATVSRRLQAAEGEALQRRPAAGRQQPVVGPSPPAGCSLHSAIDNMIAARRNAWKTRLNLLGNSLTFLHGCSFFDLRDVSLNCADRTVFHRLFPFCIRCLLSSTKTARTPDRYTRSIGISGHPSEGLPGFPHAATHSFCCFAVQPRASGCPRATTSAGPP